MIWNGSKDSQGIRTGYQDQAMINYPPVIESSALIINSNMQGRKEFKMGNAVLHAVPCRARPWNESQRATSISRIDIHWEQSRRLNVRGTPGTLRYQPTYECYEKFPAASCTWRNSIWLFRVHANQQQIHDAFNELWPLASWLEKRHKQAAQLPSLVRPPTR